MMRTKAFFLASMLLIWGFLPILSNAQVTTNITSSGLGTTLNGGVTCTSNCTITGGTRPGGGPNLFHSFGNFSVGAPDTANFFNDSGLATANILSRVTGNNPSYIFGTIQTTDFGNANLFLINPAGVIFGSTASLNVGGSFHVSTADYVRFDDPSQLAVDKPRFYADPARSSVLTSFSPDAFGFLNSNPASITVDGASLAVPLGQTISLVGGNRTFVRDDTGEMVPAGVTITGGVRGVISAPSGQINLVSVASPGEILLSNLQTGPNVNGESFTAMGTINLSAGATLDVSGDPGGAVLIRGGQFIMDAAFIRNANSGDTASGDISINAETVSLTNGAQIVSGTEANGDGGRILITTTESVSISGFDSTFTLLGEAPFGSVVSGVFTKTTSSGNGGEVLISTPTLAMDNGATIGTFASGDGRGGNISINGGVLDLSSGAQIISYSGLDFSTFDIGGTGDGGHITVTATGSVVISGGSLDLFALSNISSNSFSSGGGGNIQVSAPIVSLANGGTISSLTSGDGAGGSITVPESNQLTVSGFSDDFGTPSSIATSATATGNGGDISIDAGSVTVADRGMIQTTTDLDNPAGDISLAVTNLSVSGGGVIKTQGNGGSSPTGHIAITASGTVSVSGQFDSANPSNISNIAIVDGSDGGTSITAARFLLADGAEIKSQTRHPDGANVSIAAGETIEIASDSRIIIIGGSLASGALTLSAPFIMVNHAEVSSTPAADFDIGPITMNAGTLTLSNDAHIRTSTIQGSGQAGPIVLTASGSISISGGSTVESSSLGVATGAGGPVNVSAGGDVFISGSGSGVFSVTTTSGDGGSIAVQGNRVLLSDSGTISATSTGTGDAGSINIAASDSLVMQNGSISTATTQSDGGNIHVQANRLVQLTDSQITTSVQGGTGNGGNITIDPQFVILQNSQILAQAFGGNGGNILIVAGVFLMDPTSTVSASSTFGLSGTVQIQSTVSNLSESVAPLSGEFVQSAELLQARCAAKIAGGSSSSFVVAGRDGLPLEPGGLLPSPLYVGSPESNQSPLALDVPRLRVGPAYAASSDTLVPLLIGCAS